MLPKTITATGTQNSHGNDSFLGDDKLSISVIPATAIYNVIELFINGINRSGNI
jgi:hypothetical protein